MMLSAEHKFLPHTEMIIRDPEFGPTAASSELWNYLHMRTAVGHHLSASDIQHMIPWSRLFLRSSEKPNRLYLLQFSAYCNRDPEILNYSWPQKMKIKNNN